MSFLHLEKPPKITDSNKGDYKLNATVSSSDSRLTAIHVFISIQDKTFETHTCLLDDGEDFSCIKQDVLNSMNVAFMIKYYV